MVHNNQNNIFILKEKKKETADVVSLFFAPQSKIEPFSFIPGQFVMVGLRNKLYGIQKAYTLINLPKDELLTIAVKKLGDFSNTLCDLNKGSRVEINGPDGQFFVEDQMRKLVFIAGGIGITPFYAMIKEFFRNKVRDREIILFYSNKTENNMVFSKELNKIKNEMPNLRIIYILTRSPKKAAEIQEFGRINTKMIKRYLKKLNDYYYFVCGPTSLIIDIKNQLSDAGIEDGRIKTEFFF